MILWFILEPLIIILVGAFVLTQIIIPIITNKPMFNLFKFKKEDKEIAEISLDIEKQKEREKIKKLKKIKRGI